MTGGTRRRRARGWALLTAPLVVVVAAGWSGPTAAATPSRDARPFCTAVADVQATILGGQLSVAPGEAATVVNALQRAAPLAPTARLRSAIRAIARFYRRLESGRLPPTREVLALAKPIKTYGTESRKACAGFPMPPS